MAHPAHLSAELEWLYSVQQFGIKPGLENTRRLLKELQLPGSGQRFLHVAGTNGKGSTCAFLDSLLRAAGQRTGLFTSPHLVRFAERVRVNGVVMPEEEIDRSITALRPVVGGWDPHPTFFELTLMLALDWFDRSGAEWVVLETGMGGRLDATNAVKPVVSVITPIDLDHQQWLGDSLEEIAAEKAGILKPGVPAVSAPQPPAAAAVLRETAERVGAPLRFIDQPFTDFPLPLPGAHQRWNAALALAALEAAGFSLKPEIVRAGLSATVWPARFQRLQNGRLILDGAHNPQGAGTLARTWREEFGGEKAALLFGAVAAKDCRRSFEQLAGIAERAVFVTVNSPRAVPAEELAALWRETAPDVPCEIVPGLSEALALFPESRRLLCGSLYLCGEALALLSGGGFEASAQ